MSRNARPDRPAPEPSPLCARCNLPGADVRVSAPFVVPLHDACWARTGDGQRPEWTEARPR